MKTEIMTHSQVILRPDPSRTVIRPFAPGDPDGYAVKDHPRSQRIAARVLALDEATLARELAETIESLHERHRNVEDMLLRRFDEIEGIGNSRDEIGRDRALLIGAYFSEEYSFEAAALFNPEHRAGARSVERSGRRYPLHDVSARHRRRVMSPPSRSGPVRGRRAARSKSTRRAAGRCRRASSRMQILNDSTVCLHCEGSEDISETVLFPILERQRQGIEDLRLCRFVEDDGDICFYGTYTAFSGAEVRQEILHGHDFRTVEMRPIEGSIAHAKGAALFPRKIDADAMRCSGGRTTRTSG